MLSVVSPAKGGTNEVEAPRFHNTININATCFDSAPRPPWGGLGASLSMT